MIKLLRHRGTFRERRYSREDEHQIATCVRDRGGGHEVAAAKTEAFVIASMCIIFLKELPASDTPNSLRHIAWISYLHSPLSIQL